jgi:PAS domain S-box-containing protein
VTTSNAPSRPSELGHWDGEVETLLLDQIDAAVIALDLDGNVTHWNAHAERLYGWSRAEVLGRDAATIGFAPAASEKRAAAIEALRGGKNWEGDMERRRKDGSELLAFVKDAPLRSPDGRMIGFVGVSVDVTERRRVESMLQRRNATLQRAKKVARLESWEWNLKMDVVVPVGAGEKRTADMRGSFEEVLALRVHPDDRESVRQAAARLVAAGHGYTIFDYRGMSADGETRHISTIAEVETDAEGRPVRVWGVSQDVTEQREAERALRASERTRRRLLAQLVSAEDDERRRLAADIHDDAIQVLHAALLRTEALAAMLSDPAQEEAARQTEAALRKAVGNLRNIVAGVRQPSLDGVDLVEVVETYLEGATAEWDVTYAVEAHMTREPLPEVRAVLFRIVVEAVVNARRHSEAGRLTVRLESDDEGVRLQLADDGDGFALVADEVKEPGHYGLMTMRERAELAGGWLRVHTAPGAGTTIETWIPHLAADPDEAEPEIAQGRR